MSYEVDTGASTASSGDDYTAPSGTELTIGVGETSGTIEIVTNTDSVLEPHETLVLKLTGASTAGEVDVSATAATAQATIEDNGTVKVSVADRKASEGGSVGFEVRLSGAVSSEVVVSYATSEDGTGTNPAAGTDYTAVSATELTFRPGEALMQTVTVATVEDELNEADETFKLTISAPDPEVAGVSLGDAEAVGTITDDDELTVSVAGPVANVEEGQTATFTVTVTGTSTTAVVVSYEVDTDASTAAAPGDYTALSEVELTIGVGETSGTIEVVTNTDAVLEPDETLVLKLTGASTAGAVGVSATAATATIEDNGTVKVSVADRKASEGGSVGFEVRLSGAVSSEVVVSYATSEDGTGANPAAGTDYTAVSATELTFRPGEALMQTATVATVEDELNEADETFKLTISAPDPEVAGVSLGDAEAVGTIEDDDDANGERGWSCGERGRGTDGDVHGDGDRDEHDGGGGELRGGHRCVDGGGAWRLHGAERGGADDWRWRDERDDRGRDEHGRGAGAGRDAGVEADRSEHGWSGGRVGDGGDGDDRGQRHGEGVGGG